jgi:hypothetical protein
MAPLGGQEPCQCRADFRKAADLLLDLPPYCPELKDIERLFRTIKHHELPERRYPTFDGLDAAVTEAFTRQEALLLTDPVHQASNVA